MRRNIAELTESTYDEREGGSTSGLRNISGGLPIAAVVVLHALFCVFLFFVLPDLFGFGSSFLVLAGKDKGQLSPKTPYNGSVGGIPAGTRHCNKGVSMHIDRNGPRTHIKS